jgi:phosphoribosylamine--glycine ligase
LEVLVKVLVVGSGGREHALVWKIRQSKLVSQVFCAPGNGGIAEIAQTFDIDPTDFDQLIQLVKEKEIDLTVVGPEAPLVAGIVDAFQEAGLTIFGPTKAAAQIEGSKSFAKKLMKKYKVPTGEAAIFDSYPAALAYLKASKPPFVIKADGLAAGKGVTIATSWEMAEKALKAYFIDKKFGPAGERVLIEEYLSGPELSMLAFADGEKILPIAPAQDYKRVFDGDQGPNTGGMGSYSPVPLVSEKIYTEIVEKILKPTISGLKTEGIDYKGVLYAGLILTDAGPKVLEFNCRFGDPESQAILPRLQSDLVEIMVAVCKGELANYSLNWDPRPCVTIVAASQGYPEKYETGFEISGLESAARLQDVVVFHAGTKRRNGCILTSGGRVLNIAALGEDFSAAREKAYEALKRIDFCGMHYRRDIGIRAIEFERVEA